MTPPPLNIVKKAALFLHGGFPNPSHGRGPLRWRSKADYCIRPKRKTNTMQPMSKYITQLFIRCLHICNRWIQTLFFIVNLYCIMDGLMKICNVMSIYGGKMSQPNLAILKNGAMCMRRKRRGYFSTKIEPILFLFLQYFFCFLNKKLYNLMMS